MRLEFRGSRGNRVALFVLPNDTVEPLMHAHAAFVREAIDMFARL